LPKSETTQAAHSHQTPTLLPAVLADLSLNDAINHFLFAVALEVRPATVAYYEKSLRPLRDILKPVGAVTTDDLRLCYAQLRDRQMRFDGHPLRPVQEGGLSIPTLHKYVRAWKRFFTWLVDEGYLLRSPAAKIKRPKLPYVRPKDMTLQDLERILAAAREECVRDYAIICFLADTACRVGGVAGLVLANLNLREHRAIVCEKGGDEREVTFEDRTARALRQYLDDERRHQMDRLTQRGVLIDGRVFLGPKGPLTTSGVYLLIARLAKRAGVQGRYNPHSIRHAWARNALKRGANLKEVQQYLGHKSITTTAMFYAIYLDEELHDRHRQLTLLPPEPCEDKRADGGAL